MPVDAAGALSRGRRRDAGSDRRRRGLPGGDLPALDGAAGHRPVRRVSGAARAQSVALPLLSRDPRGDACSAPRRRCWFAAGAGRSRRGRSPGPCRAAGRPRKTTRSRRVFAPIPRSAPSTSCSWISRATTSAASARSGASEVAALRRRREVLARPAPGLGGPRTPARRRRPGRRARGLLSGGHADGRAQDPGDGADRRARSLPPRDLRRSRRLFRRRRQLRPGRSRSARPSSRRRGSGASRPARVSSPTPWPEKEYAEAEAKAAALFRAIELAREWFA